MMNGETLFEATDYFQPFPRAEMVFASQVERHSEYLLPLASIDLSHLSSDWEGRIHFVLPIEPYDGVIGEETREYHNYLCRKNWLGYRILDDKYDLACDFRFFLKAHAEATAPKGRKALQVRRALTAHYERVREGFRLRRKHFQEHGCLHHAWAKRKRGGQYAEADRVELVRNLGGVSFSGNWSEMGAFPLARYTHIGEGGEELTTAYPKTEDGRDFTFIGSIPAWHYIAENPEFTSLCGCELLLFYDPRDKVALTTFDWS
ncbi:MAG TPA: hypothetical protein VNK04_23505 [Gemmataceae bacterium]|nr:hypothetical protein [Gemmataceae bacterium]